MRRLALVLFAACTNELGPPPPAEVAAAEEAEADFEPAGEVVPVHEEPAGPSRDLQQIREAGVLRAIVHQVDPAEAPAAGSLAEADRGLCRDLGAHLELPVRFIAVPERAALLPVLVMGKGDIVCDGLLGSPSPDVAAAFPLRQTKLLIVAPTAEKVIPKKAKDLAGMRVQAQTEAAALMSLLGVVSPIAPVSEREDPEAMLGTLGAIGVGVAAVRGDALASYQRYGDDVASVLELADKLPVSWTVNAGAKALLEAVNGFLYESQLTGHRDEAYHGDLDEIVKRRVLRVAMLNNAASYFVHRGKEVGFQYDLALALAKKLGVRLQVVVPEKPDDMARLLLEGKADVAPFSTVDGQPIGGIALTRPIMFARQVLVQKAGEPPITRVEELAGKTIHVRKSSSYWPTLEALAVPGLTLVPAPEELETERLIDQVGTGAIPLTVANSVLLDVEMTYRDDVQGTLELEDRQHLTYGVRREAPRLLARLDRFVKDETKTARFKKLVARYFKDKRRIAAMQQAEVGKSGVLSPYDAITRRVAKTYGLDWRLVTAQMYQESRFDHRARSWVGALGLLQIMPKTGRRLGIARTSDLLKPEINIEAAVRYLRSLMDRFEPELDMRQRVRFAIASYNAGFHHVSDARLLAQKMGWDPNRWFDNVERAIVLLEQRKYYRKARYGFCRGSEPADYVSRIQTKYDAYVALVPE